MIINVLQKMDSITDKEAKDLLKDSGYMTPKKRITSSCSLKDFLQLVEKKLGAREPKTGETDEIAKVDKFMITLEQELVNFEERFERLLDEVEKKGLYDKSLVNQKDVDTMMEKEKAESK